MQSNEHAISIVIIKIILDNYDLYDLYDLYFKHVFLDNYDFHPTILHGLNAYSIVGNLDSG